MNIISAAEAAALIPSGAAVGIGGFGVWGGADEILLAIADRFEKEKAPRDITVVSGIGSGILDSDERGLSILKAEGLIGTYIGAHIGMPLAIGRAIGSNQIAGYMLPMGVYGQVLGALAGKRPGVITPVGLHTFEDPRLDGGRVNQRAREQKRELVELMRVGQKEYLFYKTFPIDLCIIRGTYADEDGNISLEEEAVISEQLEMATAVHNNGGTVIVQVKQLVSRGVLHPHRVSIHNSCVDYVVTAKPENHHQGYDVPGVFRPELTGGITVPLSTVPAIPLSPRKIIARRGAMELKANSLINLGVGISGDVANIINEEQLSEQLTFSIEGGTFGGVPISGAALGAAVNPNAVYRTTDSFNLYDGGGLDITCLGAAEIDAQGNVNVSKFANRCVGPGGFIDISQNTPVVCFMGTFTAGKLKCSIENQRLVIAQDGATIKFKKQVEQVTFSGQYARESHQRVLYITERAVFTLTSDGLTLTEIAPGVDLQTDVLDKMEFLPSISPELRLMDSRLFCPEQMGLAASFSPAE